jgi:hypothetical protein
MGGLTEMCIDMPNAQRNGDFAHDSAETFGFLASAFRARSYNKRVSGSLTFGSLDPNLLHFAP